MSVSGQISVAAARPKSWPWLLKALGVIGARMPMTILVIDPDNYSAFIR